MKKFLLLLICFYSSNILAINHTFYPNKLNNCKITKGAMNDYEPVSFQLTNNLLRKTGQEPLYCGTKILVKGRILDQNCVPISDAKVYLWQVGCDGKYPYIPLRKAIDKKKLNLTSSSSFTGSGTVTTNNKGEFYFITILPHSSSNEKPNVNIRVEHYNLEPLQTKLYLSSSNIVKNECGETNPSLITVQGEMSTYYFDIALPGTTLNRY